MSTTAWGIRCRDKNECHNSIKIDNAQQEKINRAADLASETQHKKAYKLR